MGNTHQPPLGFDFLHPPQIEPTEFSVVFDMPENWLSLDIAQKPEPFAFFRE
jgi:hypothetical protein